jgi:DNA-binding MarR family transcriptional regulator
MDSSKKNRSDLINALVNLSGRELGAMQIMYIQAIADRIGLNITDMRCLNFIDRASKTISAGDLVQITGLTTGAITGVIDRLEQAGFIKRNRDAKDRRLVIITMMPNRKKEIKNLFDSINRRRYKMISSLNQQELDVIKNFLVKSVTIIKDEIDTLRQENLK